MKRALRDKRTMEGRPIEEVFADFEAMQPAEGERRTRKPAKATINCLERSRDLGQRELHARLGRQVAC